MALIPLMFTTACLRTVGEGSDSPRDAGNLDAGAPAPAPDLRFKWVGGGLRASGVDGIWLTEWDQFMPSQSRDRTGPVGAWPLALNLEEESADAGVAQTMDAAASDAALDAAAYESQSVGYGPFTVVQPVEPMRTRLAANARAELDTELASVASAGMMVSAIDLKPASFIVSSAGELKDASRYQGSTAFVSRDALADWIQRAGAAGQVVTAIAGDGDHVFVAAYARNGDARRFEAKVVGADLDALAERARSLASEGLVITAFGRDGSSLLLVGTRPESVQEEHEITVESLSAGAGLIRLGSPFAIVAWVSWPREVVILER